MSNPEHSELFPTMVIGSLPRPVWVQEVIRDRLNGKISDSESNHILVDAVPLAIQLQEMAGLDYVSDGEWRRENYARVVADNVYGFNRGEVSRGPLTLNAFVVDKPKAVGSIAENEAKYLINHTDHKTLVALPSPCTIGDLMWHPYYSKKAYSTREAFVEACVPIIRAEIISLSRLGVDAIQLDEPLLPRISYPHMYGYNDVADLRSAVELSVLTINEVTKGLHESFITVHLCHSHGDEYKVIPGTEKLIMSAVNRMKVDRFAMEFNSPVGIELQALSDFPDDKMLGIGVIEPKAAKIEKPESIVERTEKALQFVDKKNIGLNPDCGFATSAMGSGNLDNAYMKLSVMSEGAKMLRNIYQI